MDEIYARVADMILERGAFQFGAFELKLHEENPDAPLSPFYLNLRTKDNPKPGPLTETDCELIAEAQWRLVQKNKLVFEAVAPIPHAADPIIEGLERVVPGPREFRIIRLAKEETAEKRRIVPLTGFDYRQGEIVLVFDDLVTKAHSKIEAIEAIEFEGSVVKDLVVLVDRLQGGKKQLEEAGYNLVTCFTILDLLDYYLVMERITQEKYQECIDYIKNN